MFLIMLKTPNVVCKAEKFIHVPAGSSLFVIRFNVPISMISKVSFGRGRSGAAAPARFSLKQWDFFRMACGDFARTQYELRVRVLFTKLERKAAG